MTFWVVLYLGGTWNACFGCFRMWKEKISAVWNVYFAARLVAIINETVETAMWNMPCQDIKYVCTNYAWRTFYTLSATSLEILGNCEVVCDKFNVFETCDRGNLCTQRIAKLHNCYFIVLITLAIELKALEEK